MTVAQPALQQEFAAGFRFPSRLVPAVAVAALAIVCYIAVLAGYFYADDFPILCFAQHYAECPAIDFFQTIFLTRVPDFQYFLYCYRPLPDIFFLATYLINGADPFWFHIANITLHALSSVFVFFIGERLLKGAPQDKLIAFVAAAAFAACPIYGEVVHGAMNAVSGTCALFFFMTLSFYLDWLEKPSKLRMLLAVLSFACAILSKEVAAILPAVLALLHFQRQPASTLRERLMSTLRNIAPFIAVLCVYIAVRTAILGPIIGGYTGALGDLNAQGWKERFFSQWPLYWLFPLHADAFPPYSLTKWLLAALYATLGGLAIYRFVKSERSPAGENRHLLQVLALWLLAVLIPVLPVWSTEPGLSGGRHGYIAAAPFFIGAAYFTFTTARKRLWCMAWCGLLAIFAYVNVRNLQVYLEASQQGRSLKIAMLSRAAVLRPDESLLLLNAPFQWKGLYIFPTSDMLRGMFQPPNVQTSINNRILLPVYWLNANYDLFSKERLRRLSRNPLIKIVGWHPSTCILRDSPLKLGDGTLDMPLKPVFQHRNQFNQLSLQRFFVEPDVLNGQADYLEFRLTCTPTRATNSSITPAASIWWQTREQPTFTPENAKYIKIITDGHPHTYRIPLNDSIADFLIQHNGCFELRLPSPSFENKLDSVKLTGWRQLAPAIGIKSLSPDRDGVYSLTGAGCDITYDATLVKSATKVVVEVSKPDSLLEYGLAHPHRAYSVPTQTALRIFRSAPSGSVNLAQSLFAKPGVYEIEVGTINSDGTFGYFSDPVFVRNARNSNN